MACAGVLLVRVHVYCPAFAPQVLARDPLDVEALPSFPHVEALVILNRVSMMIL